MSDEPTTCGNPKCIPCQIERARPGSYPPVCIETERRILAGRPVVPVDAEAAAVGARVLAWIKAGGHVEVQRGIKDDRTRREFGLTVHAWTQGEVK